jgi:16S rRNA processing protein RimM
MNNTLIGKIVGTHGVKGEVKLRSDFELKDQAFKVGNKVIIRGLEYEIERYRVHKDFDMLTFKGYNDINQILDLKGAKVYIKREDLNLSNDEYVLNDLINMTIICDDKEMGIVEDYNTGMNPLLVVNYAGKMYYIPLKGDFIEKVSLEDMRIYVNSSTKELM